MSFSLIFTLPFSSENEITKKVRNFTQGVFSVLVPSGYCFCGIPTQCDPRLGLSYCHPSSTFCPCFLTICVSLLVIFYCLLYLTFSCTPSHRTPSLGNSLLLSACVAKDITVYNIYMALLIQDLTLLTTSPSDCCASQVPTGKTGCSQRGEVGEALRKEP